MRSTKTKMIIIILSIVIVAVGALLIVTKMMPKTTESKQEEIWEYIFQGNISNEFKSYFSGEDYDTLLANKKYETTTNISFDGSNIVDNEELTTHLKNLEIDITGKVNNETNQAMGSAIVNYMKNQMFKLDYIKDNQSYGFKSDEVVDMYLGVRNNDLNLLLEKFGIQTDLSTINSVSYKELLIEDAVIDSTMQNIKEVLKEQISTDKFTKQSERKIELCGNAVTVDSYTLILNDQETYAVLGKILEKISEDEQLLNSINTKINYLVGGSNQIITKETIQTYISEIQEKTFTNEQMIMATMYILDNKMVKIDINITENGTTTQYIVEALEGSNVLNAIINTQEQDKNTSTNFSLSKDENQVYTMKLSTSENNEENFRVEIKTKAEGSLESGSVTNAVSINFIKGQNNLLIEIEDTINIVESVEIENLSASNCSFINDMEAERIQYLYTAISERIVGLYNEKMELINSGELQEQIKPANEQVEKHNAEFELYEGEYAGTIVIELLNKVIQSNATSEYLIGIETRFSETDATVLEGTEVTIEKVQPLANLLESEAMYKITISYQPVSGAIDKIKIIKSGLETTEEEQELVIQNQEEQTQ